MQEADKIPQAPSQSNQQEPVTAGVKNRIIEEIQNSVKRAQENPSLYDKGSYYKYSKS